MNAKAAKSQNRYIKTLPRQQFFNMDRLTVFLTVLLAIPPFLNGMFFDNKHYLYSVVIGVYAILFLVKAVEEHGFSLVQNKQDLAVLIFTAVYFIGLIVGVNKDGAFATFSRIWTYLLVYWMVSRLIKEQTRLNMLLYTLYGVGGYVAITPLIDAFKIYDFNDTFVSGRFYSILQYPNTLAIYMIVMSVLAYYLYNLEGRRGISSLIIAGNALIIMAFLGSLSRGAFLIYLPIMVLFIILVPNRGDFLYFYTLSWMGGITGYFLTIVKAAPNYQMVHLALLLLVLSAVGIIDYLKDYLARQGILQSKRTKIVLATAVVIVGASILGLFWQTLETSTLKLSLDRIIHMDLSDKNSLTRLAFYKDAVAMSLHKPLFGFGGQGWQSAYKAYQQHLYYSTEVHNHWLQVLVESGYIGFIAYLTIWFYGFQRLFKGYLTATDIQVKNLGVVLIVALSSLALHTALDFDFSIGAVYLLFWILIGLSEGYIPDLQTNAFKGARYFKWTNAAALLICILMLISTASASISLNQLIAAEKAVASEEYKKAEGHYQLAARFNPISANVLSKFSILYFNYGLGEDNNNLLKIATDKMQEAMAYDKLNPSIRVSLAQMYFTTGQIEKAVEQMERSVDYERMHINNYVNLMNVNFTAGMEAKKQKDKAAVEKYMKAVLGVKDKMAGVWAQVAPERRAIWADENYLEPSPQMYLYMAKAYIVMSNYQQAASYLQQAAGDKKIHEDVKLWQALLDDLTGNAAALESSLSELEKANPDKLQDYKSLKEIITN